MSPARYQNWKNLNDQIREDRLKMNMIVGILHFLKWAGAAILGCIMSIDGTLTLLAGFILADAVSGILSSFIQKKLDSDVGLRGMIKKMMIIAFVLVISKGETIAGLNVHSERWLAAYFIILEMISIVENCANAGMDIPAPIVLALVKVKGLMPKSMTAAEIQHAFHPEICIVDIPKDEDMKPLVGPPPGIGKGV